VRSLACRGRVSLHAFLLECCIRFTTVCQIGGTGAGCDSLLSGHLAPLVTHHEAHVTFTALLLQGLRLLAAQHHCLLLLPALL
jgi:hypothetical protein